MSYPISDHYDGTHFFNPEPTIRPGSGKSSGFLSILRARMRRRDPAVWATWPKWVENKAHAAPVGDGLSVTFVGHSSFLIRLPGLTALTDPVFSERCSPVQWAGPKRVRAPGLALDALPEVDLILLSHNHYDHMDLISLKKIRRRFPRVRIVTTLGTGRYLAKKGVPGAVELDWWEAVTLGEAQVTVTPARHFAARTLWDRNEALWGGMYLTYRGHKIYFGGDSGYTKFFKEIGERLGAPDLALLPIGAYEPRWFMGPVHMNPEDAVKAFQDLQPRQAIGMHYGTFQLTAEEIDAPLQDLALARAAAGIPEGAFVALDIGESWSFREEEALLF